LSQTFAGLLDVQRCVLRCVLEWPCLIAMLLFVARLWHLCANCIAAEARSDSKVDHWILSRRRLYAPGCLWVGVSLTFCALASTRLVLEIRRVCSPSGVAMEIVGFFAVWAMTVLTLVVLLRRMQDGFWMGVELQLLFLVLCCVGVLGGVYFRQKDVLGPYRFHLYALLLGGIAWCVISSWYPVLLSLETEQPQNMSMRQLELASLTDHTVFHHTQTRGHASHQTDRLSMSSRLVHVLQHQAGFEAFKLFLQHEFSVESVLCWAQVAEVIATHARLNRVKEFNDEYARVVAVFVAPGSPNEVNIPSGLKKRLLELATAECDKWGPDDVEAGANVGLSVKKIELLRRLQSTILLTMERDPFQRFIKSRKFQQIVTNQPPETKNLDVGVSVT
ncbi:hypothetical protein PBRA_000877, partial [Plasmodiophora brassicae]